MHGGEACERAFLLAEEPLLAVLQKLWDTSALSQEVDKIHITSSSSTDLLIRDLYVARRQPKNISNCDGRLLSRAVPLLRPSAFN